MNIFCCVFSVIQQLPNSFWMLLSLTIMLALPFNRFDDSRDARCHNISLPSHIPGVTNTQLLSVEYKSMDLEGPLYRAHVAAIICPKLSSSAGHHYKLINAVSRVGNSVRQLLGKGVQPRARAQERPTTAPTRWFCHKCNSGPYSIAAQSGCTNVINGRQCDHRRCDYCKKE